MTKQQIIREAQEWLTTPNRAVELYKRGEPTFEVDATSDASAIKCLWCQGSILQYFTSEFLISPTMVGPKSVTTPFVKEMRKSDPTVDYGSMQ